uniref:Uncharacterized protein n=1 Tax=Fervidicoccus fontis TaxID=683846 RepID=A0A7J3SLM6_9CREN
MYKKLYLTGAASSFRARLPAFSLGFTPPASSAGSRGSLLPYLAEFIDLGAIFMFAFRYSLLQRGTSSDISNPVEAKKLFSLSSPSSS